MSSLRSMWTRGPSTGPPSGAVSDHVTNLYPEILSALGWSSGVPFNQLLCKCLLAGRTSVSEQENPRTVVPESGECVLAFQLDRPEFRKGFDVEDQAICDHLFFYKKSAGEPILVCVELKGANISRAADQVGNVIRLLRKNLAKLAFGFRA